MSPSRLLVLLVVAACGDNLKLDLCAAQDACPLAAAHCEGETLVTPTSHCEESGYAVDCNYDDVRTDCAAQGMVCGAGGCRTPDDPCLTEPCNTPPDPSCDGESLVTFDAQGTCDSSSGQAVCTYAQHSADCTAQHATCMTGNNTASCVDVCTGVTCDTPPADDCTVNTRHHYPATGTCDSSTGSPVCTYTPVDTDCTATDEQCAAGACFSPCTPTTCESPPTNTCVDAMTARQYASNGACTSPGGVVQCDYGPVDVDCGAMNKTCTSGACTDPCTPDPCTSPPMNMCATSILADQYPNPGACTSPGGVVQCTYVPFVVDCGEFDQACTLGACTDPCTGFACTTPPSPTCTSHTLTTYSSPGSCSSPGGAPTCSYAPTQTDCTLSGQHCVAGACVTEHAIGGTITGLSGTGLVIGNSVNGGPIEQLGVSANGTFAFPTGAPTGSTYAVSVTTQPGGPTQTCVVSNASGTANSDVTTVSVDCPPFVVANGLDVPSTLAIHGSTLYFERGLPPSVTDCYSGTGAGDAVMLVPADGSSVPTKIDDVHHVAGNCGVYGLVFDATYVYWANYADAAIVKATFAGASVTPVFSAGAYMNALACDGSNLYYHQYGFASISRVSTAGTGNTTFVTAGSINGQNLAIDATNLYFTDGVASDVDEVALSATPPATPTILSNAEPGAVAPFVTATRLYWIQTGNPGHLRYTPLASPAAATLDTTSLATPSSVVADASYAYVVAYGTAPNYTDGRIYKIPSAGGAPVIIAKGLFQPSSIVMDAGHIYWINNSTTTGSSRNSDGTIMMIVK